MTTLINFESLHFLELELIRSIHAFRTPFMDNFFTPFDFFDRKEFFLILIPTMWFLRGRKAGLSLMSILLISGLTNSALKEYFSSPRPFHIDPSLGIIQVSGYGFPSGAAQTVILLSGILLSYWKSSLMWFIATIYVLFVSFSRVYLGIHFPSDIIVGWLVGLFLWKFYTYMQPLIERWLTNFQSHFLIR